MECLDRALALGVSLSLIGCYAARDKGDEPIPDAISDAPIAFDLDDRVGLVTYADVGTEQAHVTAFFDELVVRRETTGCAAEASIAGCVVSRCFNVPGGSGPAVPQPDAHIVVDGVALQAAIEDGLSVYYGATIPALEPGDALHVSASGTAVPNFDGAVPIVAEVRDFDATVESEGLLAIAWATTDGVVELEVSGDRVDGISNRRATCRFDARSGHGRVPETVLEAVLEGAATRRVWPRPTALAETLVPIEDGAIAVQSRVQSSAPTPIELP